MRRLYAYLETLGLPDEVIVHAVAQLAAFYELLARWNRAHNLVARRDVADVGRFERRHLIDSVGLMPWMKGTHTDIGSGGGLPGIPLAILRPEERTVLVERSRKKCQFLRHVALELGLDFEVCERDARDVDERADVVTARAVAPLDALWPIVPNGVFLLQTATPLDDIPEGVAAEPSVEVATRFVTVVRDRS